VEEHDAGSIPDLEARFEHVHPEAVDVVDEAGADAGREHRRAVRLRTCRLYLSARLRRHEGRRDGGGERLHQPTTCHLCADLDPPLAALVRHGVPLRAKNKGDHEDTKSRRQHEEDQS
jgi:hypothetical protein